jgi:hypothetical protein
MRCSDGSCADRLGGGLTPLGARSLTGVGVPLVLAVGLTFFGDARRSSAFFAVFFRLLLALVTALRVALLTGCVFRFALVFPLAFFLVAIAASLMLTV